MNIWRNEIVKQGSINRLCNQKNVVPCSCIFFIIALSSFELYGGTNNDVKSKWKLCAIVWVTVARSEETNELTSHWRTIHTVCVRAAVVQYTNKQEPTPSPTDEWMIFSADEKEWQLWKIGGHRTSSDHSRWRQSGGHMIAGGQAVIIWYGLYRFAIGRCCSHHHRRRRRRRYRPVRNCPKNFHRNQQQANLDLNAFALRYNNGPFGLLPYTCVHLIHFTTGDWLIFNLSWHIVIAIASTFSHSYFSSSFVSIYSSFPSPSCRTLLRMLRRVRVWRSLFGSLVTRPLPPAQQQ